MARTDEFRATLASTYASSATYASLHTSDPGTTGDFEVSGGSPAYARRPINWTADGAGGLVSATIEFDVPTATDVTDVGLWDSATGGTYLDSVAASGSFASQGTFRVVLTYTQV